MKKKVLLIGVFICCIISQISAQNNNIIQLLDAYDYLYFNRINKGYVDSATRAALFEEAEKAERMPQNDAFFKQNYQALYTRYKSEYYYLSNLVYLDKHKNDSYTQLLPVLDTVINWYNNLKIETDDSTAMNTLRRTAGLRAESVTFSNKELYDTLINRYNTILLSTLQQQLKDYRTSRQYDFALVDTIFKRYKFHSNNHQADYSTDDTFQSMLQVYAYFRALQETNKNCDSLLYYYTWHKALKARYRPKMPDTPDLNDTITNCNKDPALLAGMEDSVYEMLSSITRGGPEIPHGMASFPWPPPEPSSRSQPLNLKLKNINTLAEANLQLVNALSLAKYNQFDYYYVPDGFALVTPLEQIQTDGTPKGDPPRWDVKVQLSQDFSFMNYLKALFMGERGYYRIMVFIITDKPFSFTKSNTISRIQNLEGGINDLPAELGAQPYTPNHRCTVLVYEFEKKKSGDATSFIKPGRYSVQTHLQKTLIWKNLFE